LKSARTSLRSVFTVFQSGISIATLHPVAKFCKLYGRGEHHKKQQLYVRGQFTLGDATNCINPLSDTITRQIGSDTITLPPSSFKPHNGEYVINGSFRGASVSMQVEQRSKDECEFSARGNGANANPLSIGLTIGDDSGTTTARMVHDE
jgi:hypothetical protein